MDTSALNHEVDAILQITEQMRTAAEGDNWEKTTELQTALDTELHKFFSRPIEGQDAKEITKTMIKKVMESEQQLLELAQTAKTNIHTASKQLSKEVAALAAYAHSIK